MAIIPIDENWRLKSDELGWVVQRSRRRNESPVNAEHAVESAVKGPPRRDREWTGVRYYPKLSDALVGYLRLIVMASDVEGVSAVRRAIEEAEARIHQALADCGLDKAA